MNKNIIKNCAATALLGLASISAHASTIEMMPLGSTNIGLGDTMTFEIWADFSDVGGTIGGGMDIFYDFAVLSYNNDFSFDAGLNADLSISRVGDDCSVGAVLGCVGPGQVGGISPNSFGGMAAAGPVLMGTLSFTAMFEGLTMLTMADSAVYGPWYDNSTFGPVFPTYNNAMVNVSAVPVPAAAWLMLSGMGVLGGFARRKANA